jgi:hypothetical protein
LPDDGIAPRLGRVWRDAITGYDRERAFRALEVATLFALRRSVRNGSVWIGHSLTFLGRERLFFPAQRWQAEALRHYTRLSLPAKCQREPKFPQRRELKIPHPVHAAVSSARTRPAFNFSFRRYELPRMFSVTA